MHVFAVLLAVVSAIGLATGTHLQHRAVSTQTTSSGASAGASVVEAIRRPAWLLGMTVMVAATLVSVVALGLAPVALVQPIGALSLVCAALISARVLRVRINRGLVTGIGLAVLSVGAFVGLSAGFVRESTPSDAELFALAGLMLALIVVAVVVVRASRGHLARVITAGVLFGSVAAAVHIVASEAIACLGGGACRLVGASAQPLPIAVLFVLLVSGSVLGGWLVQTAYASGPPETVLAGLTVIDPIVAVLIGAAILGEYVIMPFPVVLALICTAAVACFGVALIVRHHPGHLASPATPAGAPVEAVPAPRANAHVNRGETAIIECRGR